MNRTKSGATGGVSSADELSTLRSRVQFGSILVLVLAATLLLTLPRSVSYSSLVEENEELRLKLQAIDEKMSDVDRLFLRLKIYDAQLRSVGNPIGDHGPLDKEDFSSDGLLDAAEALSAGDAPEGLVDALPPADLRPAGTWADAVLSRAESFIDVFEQAEPNLNELVVELEDLRALEAALPTLYPAEGTFTSGFGWRRAPVGRRDWKHHAGIDIANRPGTPIYASASGVVVQARYNSGYGRAIEISHGYGITTLYAHCTTLYVREGDTVSRGQKIGTIGSTGRVTGPHLHFEVRLNGTAVNPLDYLEREVREEHSEHP